MEQGEFSAAVLHDIARERRDDRTGNVALDCRHDAIADDEAREFRWIEVAIAVDVLEERHRRAGGDTHEHRLAAIGVQIVIRVEDDLVARVEQDRLVHADKAGGLAFVDRVLRAGAVAFENVDGQRADEERIGRRDAALEDFGTRDHMRGEQAGKTPAPTKPRFTGRD